MSGTYPSSSLYIHFHRFHFVYWMSYFEFIVCLFSNITLSLSYFINIFQLSPFLFFPHLFFFPPVCPVLLCMCLHVHSLSWYSRGGEETPPQTNSPLSLKAMNSLQAGHRTQAGPAGKHKRNVETLNNVLIGNGSQKGSCGIIQRKLDPTAT